MSHKGKKSAQPDTKTDPTDTILGAVPGAFATQAISDPYTRFPETRVAKPSDDDVVRNREWVQTNQK